MLLIFLPPFPRLTQFLKNPISKLRSLFHDLIYGGFRKIWLERIVDRFDSIYNFSLSLSFFFIFFVHFGVPMIEKWIKMNENCIVFYIKKKTYFSRTFCNQRTKRAFSFNFVQLLFHRILFSLEGKNKGGGRGEKIFFLNRAFLTSIFNSTKVRKIILFVLSMHVARPISLAVLKLKRKKKKKKKFVRIIAIVYCF